MRGEDVLVVVPHAGLAIPPEVPVASLSEDFPALARNIDWHTDWLYDFRDILANQQLVFPYCSLVLEANRDPDLLDESVPLRDVHGRAVYREGSEPTPGMRADMSARHLKTFHSQIEERIAAGATFLFDGHATVTACGVADDQIDLMSFQNTRRNGLLRYCPEAYVETYAAELRRRLPDVQVTVNGSEYWRVHGHVCAAHCIDALTRVGSRAPALIQETNMRLYCLADGTPSLSAINRLRRAFAESLWQALRTVRGTDRRGSTVIDLHVGRQTFDYDCGAQALQTVMAHYGVDVRGDQLMKALGTGTEGTTVKAMIAVAQSHGFEVRAGADWSLAQLKRWVNDGYPVIVALQAWASRYMTLDDWRRDYDDGHYAIVIGLDAGVLLFEDPSSFRHTWLRDREFLARWHDRDPVTGQALHHFGMVLLGGSPAPRAPEHMG